MSAIRFANAIVRSLPKCAPASTIALRSFASHAQRRGATNLRCGNQTRSFSAVGEEFWTDFVQYPEARAKIGQEAPIFSAKAVIDGEISSINLEDFRGKYVVLFFYPKDFTFVCPTEIIAFSDRAKEFEALNTQLIACSTDTEECHLAWTRVPRNQGGLGHMNIPIVADTDKVISSRYGVLHESSAIALRGLFIINPEGVLEQITINNFPVGRSVDETLRLLQAFQYVKEHGEVCPANWKPGGKTMIANPEDSQAYFASVAEEAESAPSSSKITSISSRKEYDNIIASGKPIVADFMAPWCGKCQQLLPYIEQLAEQNETVQFLKVDTTVPELEALSKSLDVKVLPSFHFFKDGKSVAEPITGYKKRHIAAEVEKLAKSI